MLKQKRKSGYKFDDLSPQAKENAREWWRECEAQDFDPLDRDDITTIATIMGVTFEMKRITRTRTEPDIHWSLGDRAEGVSFNGQYTYPGPDSCDKIRSYAPQDAELHGIVDTLHAVQWVNANQVTARVQTRASRGHSVEAEVYVDGDEVDGPVRDIVDNAMSDFAAWMLSQFQKDYEWRMADEQVDENILANEYEFDEDGNIC